MSDLVFRNGGKLAALAVLTIVVGVAGADGVKAQVDTCPTTFNLPAGTVCDLNGEVCVRGWEDIQYPDGRKRTFCIMQGRLKNGEAMEMDDIYNDLPLATVADSVGDANVIVGPDGYCPPGVFCNDPDLPNIPGATYIDWNDLYFNASTRPDGIGNTTDLAKFSDGKPIGAVEDHRIMDFTANKDWTIFSSGESCVTDGSSLPKEDFTQSYLANNDRYLYFSQERRTTNGNSVYYWMLTDKPPTLVPNGACGANTRGELQFTLTGRNDAANRRGDLQVILNFPNSSDPASGQIFLREFRGADVSNVPAADAVFASGWHELTGAENPIRNFALVTHPVRTVDPDDIKPLWGGLTAQGEVVRQNGSLNYETTEMAEWAIDLFEVFGGQPLCGRRLFLTGVSRSATGQIGNLTEPADLKDLVGPKVYSFGELTASATITPLCDPVLPNGFDYLFDFAASATDVTNTPIPLSRLECVWTCTSETCADPVLDFDDGSLCTGRGRIPRDQGALHAGPCDVSCTVSVTEVRSQCVDDASITGDVLAPVIVDIAANPNARSCTPPPEPGASPGDIALGITYIAAATGGDLDYTYVWSVTGPSPACGNTVDCNIAFAAADYCARTDVNVTVKEGSICPDVTSETEVVTKVTSMSGTNNP